MAIRHPSGVIDLPAHALTRRSAIGVVLAAVLGAIPGKLRAGGQSVTRVRRAYHDGRFGQLHYRIAGTAAAGGPRPLLCLHGSPYSGRIYETFLAVMGADRIALATDTPGFGDSDPPATVPAMSDHAAAIGDLLDASAFGEIDLLGCQAGSALAVELALQRPRQVRRVAMISAPLFTRAEIDARKGRLGPVVPAADGSHLAEAWRRIVGSAMPGWTLDHAATQFPDVIRQPAISWWGEATMLDYPLADRLPQLRQSILLLNPQDEWQDRTRRARALAANVDFRELPGWCLGFLDIRADELAGILRGFLDPAGA